MNKKLDFSEVQFKNIGFEITSYYLKKYDPPVYSAISFFKGNLLLGCEKLISDWIFYFDDNRTLLNLIIGGSIIPVSGEIWGSIPLKLTMKDKERLIRYLIKTMKLKLSSEERNMLIIQFKN